MRRHLQCEMNSCQSILRYFKMLRKKLFRKFVMNLLSLAKTCWWSISQRYRIYLYALARASRSKGTPKTVIRIESVAGIWSFRLNFVKNLCLNYYLFNFRGDNASVFQRVSMNLNMTGGQPACQLLCRYSLLKARWLRPACVELYRLLCVTLSIKRSFGCSCLKCTWSVA